MALGGGHVIVDAVDEVAVGVEHRETLAVEKERLLPHGQHHRIITADFARGGVWIYLGHAFSVISIQLNKQWCN